MKPWMQRLFIKDIRRAIDTFNLIQPGDQLLIGVSGGKDSTLLFYALTLLSQYEIYDFKVTGLTVDHGMLGNIEAYQAFCESKKLDLKIHKEHYAVNLSHDNEYAPCYTCSRLRKGIVKAYAQKHGYNKIAYGHTKDDLVETFMMNIIQHGKLSAIPAVQKEADSQITLVRPLLYVKETDIIKAIEQLNVPLMHDTCTFAKDRLRHHSESLIAQIELTEPLFSDKVVQALHRVDTSRLLG